MESYNMQCFLSGFSHLARYFWDSSVLVYSFFTADTVSLYGLIRFVYSFINEHLGYFQLCGYQNNAVINTYVQVVGICYHVSLNFWVKLLGHIVSV